MKSLTFLDFLMKSLNFICHLFYEIIAGSVLIHTASTWARWLWMV